MLKSVIASVEYGVNLIHRSFGRIFQYKPTIFKRNTTTAPINPSFQKVKEKLQPLTTVTVGQPTPYSHPHILRKGEVLPNISKDELQIRRHRLLHALETHSPSCNLHIVLIPSSRKKFMTEKIPYIFRQDSDFLYLSGCLEPDSALMLTSHDKRRSTAIFIQGKDPQAELWDGPRTGVELATEMFGVDHSYQVSELGSYLRHFLKSTTGNSEKFTFWYDYLAGVNDDILKIARKALPENKPCESPRLHIHRLRLYKSKAEQELMREACSIGSRAIMKTIRHSKPHCSEAQLFAKVDYECRMMGAQYMAYPPVIASGPRANIIHYINNNQIVEPGDLVLMDAGCDYHGYSSDITRTWPISGKFTPEQRKLYDVLCHVQTSLIKECANRPTLNKLFQSMCLLLGKSLRELGVISFKLTSDSELSRAAYALCPHHVGHYLGMDVHDTALIPRSINLEPGMVITVEPGIYIGNSSKVVNSRYHGLGMRIEDDVLITDAGVEVLSSGCPKDADEIERLLTKSAWRQ